MDQSSSQTFKDTVVFVSSTFGLNQEVFASYQVVRTEQHKAWVRRGWLTGQHALWVSTQSRSNIPNLFTLNVRGQNITHQISLGENKSLWRFKKKGNRKEKPWNLYSVQPLLYIWGGVRVQNKGDSGPGACSAEIATDESDPFRLEGVEMGSTPMKPSSPPQTMCWVHDWDFGGGAAAASAAPAQRAAGTGPTLRAC